VVLDAKLPARLAQVSDLPEGSRANPLLPDLEVVGVVEVGAQRTEITLERVDRTNASVWLFSSRTLQAVPSLYDQVLAGRARVALPAVLTDTRVGGIPIAEWVTVLIAVPLLYFAIGLLNRLFTPLARGVSRRLFKESGFLAENALPAPARLLVLAIATRWLLSSLAFSLLLRQICSAIADALIIISITWLFMLLNAVVEKHLLPRLGAPHTAAVALLRVARRGVDVLVIFVALIAMLRHFGVDPTPALAGLGVGGIAVALAAQKTLENVIAGASLIFDQAVRVGDTLKMGEIVGTVEHIGLRSTRIRTLDRTLVTVPNSQIANVSLETLSARDKFWFHPVVALRYETTAEQLQVVIDQIRRLLEQHSSVSRESVRVRFFRLGPSSLDIEVFSYVFATDWTQFLEIQERLLIDVTDIVGRAGTAIAFPSQTMYLTREKAEGTREKAEGTREKEKEKEVLEF
jgi:MscS family membrane protein